MALEQGGGRADQTGGLRHSLGEPDEYDWPGVSHHITGYDLEDELADQLAKLPSKEDVEELCSALRVATLRELSSEIVKAGMEIAKGNIDRLEHVKFINSWIATAEETVAAGRNLNRIAARRRKQS